MPKTIDQPGRWTATLWTLLMLDYPEGDRLYAQCRRASLIPAARMSEASEAWDTIGDGS